MPWILLPVLLLAACSGSESPPPTGDTGDTGAGLDQDGDGYGARDDCDDTNPDIHPGADELCDGVNNDCDAAVDEPDAVDAVEWCRDSDQDGFGDGAVTTRSCDQPPGFIADGSDCDDTSALAYPGAEEVCGDGVDNDCDSDPTECRLTGTYSLSKADRALPGGAAGDRAGELLAGADLSGDGAADLLMGMTGYGEGGAIHILLAPLPASASLASPDAILESGERSSGTGQAASPAGDRDGDGHADLAVAVPGSDLAALDAGAVFLAGGPFRGAVSLPDVSIATVTGESSYDQLGAGVVADLDIDGDGRLDLLVSADRYGTGSDPYLGAAYLLLGPLSGPVSLGDAAARITGTARYDRIGAVLAGADVNGDGLDDMAVGSWSYPSNGGQGVVGVFWGPVSGERTIEDADARLDGSTDSGRAGQSLSIGDVNGDGYADLLIGAPFDTGAEVESGAVYLVHGPPSGGALVSQASAVLLGVGDDDEAGTSVSGDGDFDGDGCADVLVGAPGEAAAGRDAGRAYFFYGPVSGSVLLDDGDIVLAGAIGRQRAGETVSLAADTNADGLADIAVSAPEDDTGGSDAGIVYLLYGVGL
jgi:hypothetical protein